MDTDVSNLDFKPLTELYHYVNTELVSLAGSVDGDVVVTLPGLNTELFKVGVEVETGTFVYGFGRTLITAVSEARMRFDSWLQKEQRATG